MTYDDDTVPCFPRQARPSPRGSGTSTWSTSIQVRVNAEVIVEYVNDDSRLPAGVAFTHPTLGYQVVTLGFGLEDTLADASGGTAIEDRVDFIENIMAYFAKPPDGPGTGIDDSHVTNMMSTPIPTRRSRRPASTTGSRRPVRLRYGSMTSPDGWSALYSTPTCRPGLRAASSGTVQRVGRGVRERGLLLPDRVARLAEREEARPSEIALHAGVAAEPKAPPHLLQIWPARASASDGSGLHRA